MSKNTSKPSKVTRKVATVAKSKTALVKNRIVSTLKNAKTMAISARNKTVAGAKATDKAVRKHPYKAIAVAVGAGVLAGALLGRRGGRKAAPAATES